jgi:hypothetical protein
MSIDLYQDLDTGRHEIRLLRVSPCFDFNAPVESELFKASLRDELQPDYHALSYVCGDPDVTTPITVYGLSRAVTLNLEAALRHVRGEVEPIIIWADAVCINQHDLVERGSQVQMMDMIFSRARRVIA